MEKQYFIIWLVAYVLSILIVVIIIKKHKKSPDSLEFTKDVNKRDIYALFSQVRNLNKWISHYKQRISSSTIKHFVYLVIEKKSKKVVTCFEAEQPAEQFIMRQGCDVKQSKYIIQEIQVK